MSPWEAFRMAVSLGKAPWSMWASPPLLLHWASPQSPADLVPGAHPSGPVATPDTLLPLSSFVVSTMLLFHISSPLSASFSGLFASQGLCTGPIFPQFFLGMVLLSSSASFSPEDLR